MLWFVDEITKSAPRRFLIDVEETLRLVLEQEDTDGDFQVRLLASSTSLSLRFLLFARKKKADERLAGCGGVDLHHRLWT